MDEIEQMALVINNFRKIRQMLDLTENKIPESIANQIALLKQLGYDTDEINKMFENNLQSYDYRRYTENTDVKLLDDTKFKSYRLKCRLNDIRKNRGLTVKQMADLLECSEVSFYKKSTTEKISLKNASIIAAKLGLKITDIWEFSEK